MLKLSEALQKAIPNDGLMLNAFVEIYAHH